MEELIKIYVTKDELLIMRNAIDQLAIDTHNVIEMLENQNAIDNDRQGYYKTKHRNERLLEKYVILSLKMQNIIDNNN